MASPGQPITPRQPPTGWSAGWRFVHPYGRASHCLTSIRFSLSDFAGPSPEALILGRLDPPGRDGRTGASTAAMPAAADALVLTEGEPHLLTIAPNRSGRGWREFRDRAASRAWRSHRPDPGWSLVTQLSHPAHPLPGSPDPVGDFFPVGDLTANMVVNPPTGVKSPRSFSHPSAQTSINRSRERKPGPLTPRKPVPVIILPTFRTVIPRPGSHHGIRARARRREPARLTTRCGPDSPETGMLPDHGVRAGIPGVSGIAPEP